MNKTQIISRLKSALNIETDKALSEYLGISKSTLSGWYARNTFDYDLVFEKCPYLSPSFLIYGDGVPFRNSSQVINQTINAPVRENSNVINGTDKNANYPVRDIVLHNIPIIPFYCYSQQNFDVSKYVRDNSGSIATAPPIPQFASYDLYYIVNDDILEPFALKGDILAIQKMRNTDRPLASRLYVVDTETDGLLAARVSTEADGNLRLKSVNPAYANEDLVVPPANILNLFKVVGLARTM